MLWMYAELERTGQGRLDLVYELSDYLLALELVETSELAEQAERLFRLRLAGGRAGDARDRRLADPVGWRGA